MTRLAAVNGAFAAHIDWPLADHARLSAWQGAGRAILCEGSERGPAH